MILYGFTLFPNDIDSPPFNWLTEDAYKAKLSRGEFIVSPNYKLEVSSEIIRLTDKEREPFQNLVPDNVFDSGFQPVAKGDE
jgi:hypothetical protein